MSALELEVYEIFKKHFTEKEAAKVISYFEAKAEEKIAQKRDVFMTKDDKVELVSRIESSKAETIKWMFICVSFLRRHYNKSRRNRFLRLIKIVCTINQVLLNFY